MWELSLQSCNYRCIEAVVTYRTIWLSGAATPAIPDTTILNTIVVIVKVQVANYTCTSKRYQSKVTVCCITVSSWF
jgi:hypothetical protein